MPLLDGRRRDAALELALRPARDRRARQAAAALRDGGCAADRGRARLRGRGVHARRLGTPAAGGRSDRRGSVRRAGGRQRPGRGRPARRLVRPHADPARPARPAPARSSSQTPRTSCGRRSSRSRASSSCSTTRISTRRRAGSSSRRRGARSIASRTSRPTCSTSRGWTPAGSGSSARRWAGRGRAAWSRRTSSRSRTPRATRSCSTSTRTPWALADEERVQQIARALAGNALVHTPPGTTVRLRVERRGDARRADGRGRRPGDPARAPRPRVSALLSRRRRPGVRQRPRARDRARARGQDGRHGHRREHGPVRRRSRSSCRPRARRMRGQAVSPPSVAATVSTWKRSRHGGRRVAAERRGYSDTVRAPVFAVAAVAAILGAGVALALGGLIGGSATAARRRSSSSAR